LIHKKTNSLNNLSVKDIEEKIRKKLEQISRIDEGLVEQVQVKKTWEKFGKGETLRKVYLYPLKEWSEKDKLKIDNFIKQNPNFSKENNDNLNHEQFITNRLKTENEKLKNNQSLTNSEKENRLQKNQEKFKDVIDNCNTKQPTNTTNSLLVGGIAVLILGGMVIGVLISSKRNKKVKKLKKVRD